MVDDPLSIANVNSNCLLYIGSMAYSPDTFSKAKAEAAFPAFRDENAEAFPLSPRLKMQRLFCSFQR